MIYLNGKTIERADSTPKFPPALAYAMVKKGIAGFDQCALYDPFCGKGTIVLIGGLNFSQINKIYANDLDEEASIATEINLEKTNITNYLVSNENANSKIIKDANLIVVTDPPFGRACEWEGSIDLFLENMTKQNVKWIVMCYDKNKKLDRTINNYFILKEKELIKDRFIYTIENN